MGMHTGKLDETKRLWEIAKANETFTAFDLSADARRSLEFVRLRLKLWLKWGYIEELAEKRGMKKLYRITVKGQAHTPVLDEVDGQPIREGGSANENMWRSMRMMVTFDHVDIAMQSNTVAQPVTEEQARSYCQMLANAGYLQVLKKAGKGRNALYKLVKNTGPKPPREKRVRAVYDDNKRAFTYVAGGVS